MTTPFTPEQERLIRERERVAFIIGMQRSGWHTRVAVNEADECYPVIARPQEPRKKRLSDGSVVWIDGARWQAESRGRVGVEGWSVTRGSPLAITAEDCRKLAAILDAPTLGPDELEEL